MWYRAVIKHTGMIKRTENSLNQHIKLKHQAFWKQLKDGATSRKDSEQKPGSDNVNLDFD